LNGADRHSAADVLLALKNTFDSGPSSLSASSLRRRPSQPEWNRSRKADTPTRFRHESPLLNSEQRSRRGTGGFEHRSEGICHDPVRLSRMLVIRGVPQQKRRLSASLWFSRSWRKAASVIVCWASLCLPGCACPCAPCVEPASARTWPSARPSARPGSSGVCPDESPAA